MSNKNIVKVVQALFERPKFTNHEVSEQVLCHRPRRELKLNSGIARKHPDDIVEESCESAKRSRFDEDDLDPTDTAPKTSVSCSSTSSRHVGGDKAKGKMKGKATTSQSPFITDEFIAELRALRLQREKDIDMMSRKMDTMMLVTLLKKSHLSSEEEELKHRLMDKLYPH